METSPSHTPPSASVSPTESQLTVESETEEKIPETPFEKGSLVIAEERIIIGNCDHLARAHILKKVEKEEEKESETVLNRNFSRTSASDSNNRGLSGTLTNFELERQSNFKGSLLFIFSYFIMEIGKQLSNFSLSKSGTGRYPLPGPLLVVLIETTKLCIILAASQIIGFTLRARRPSPYFAIPAFCYFGANLFYLYSITKVSPPIWILLIQSKTLYVATFYRVIFKRQVTTLQWIGCLMIVTSIGVVRLSQIGSSTIPLSILALSQVAAVLSSTASLSIEVLLKNDRRHYVEQQLWLYVFGILVGFLYYLKPGSLAETVTSIEALMQTANSSLIQKLVLAITCTAFSGVLVPLILKNLDAIVKDYLAAMNNLLLSLLTAALFPEEFSLSATFLFSLVILICGIFLFERKFLYGRK